VLLAAVHIRIIHRENNCSKLIVSPTHTKFVIDILLAKTIPMLSQFYYWPGSAENTLSVVQLSTEANFQRVSMTTQQISMTKSCFKMRRIVKCSSSGSVPRKDMVTMRSNALKSNYIQNDVSEHCRQYLLNLHRRLRRQSRHLELYHQR
jgi:hypothetical protein